MCSRRARYNLLHPIFSVGTDKDIQIWHLRGVSVLPNSGAAPVQRCRELVDTLDTGYLLSAGSGDYPVVRCWDTFNWKQIGDPWTGHENDDDIKYTRQVATVHAALPSASRTTR